MQAPPISNPPTASAPSIAPAPASLLPFDSHQPSPFTAVFHAVLKVAGNSAKNPAAGKAQDSGSKSPAANSMGNNPQVLFLPGIIPNPLAPIPVEPSVPFAAPQVSASSKSENEITQKAYGDSTKMVFLKSDTGNASGPAWPSGAPKNIVNATNSILSDATAGPAGNSDRTAQGLPAQNVDSSGQNAGQNLNAGPISDSDADLQKNGAAATNPLPFTSEQMNQAAISANPAQQNNISIAGPTVQGVPTPTVDNSKMIATVADPSANQEAIHPAAAQNIPEPSPDLAAQNGKSTQAAHADLKFLNMQSQALPVPALKAALSVSAQPAIHHDSQLNSLPLPNTSPSLTETLEHSAAGSVSVGAPTLKFHDHAKTQSESAAPAIAAPVVSAKAQTQDGASGSSTNDSNSKPDRSSNVASVRTENKGFVQTLDTAAANPAGGHSGTADPTSVAAALPAQTQPANSGTPPGVTSPTVSHSAETLPAPAQGTAVVNSAHILVQPGQTEIRIEMQAESLGGIELRAHIAGDQIGASISVEHHDAQVALTTDLPALHNALAEKNLRLETLTVTQGSFSSLSGGLGQDAGQRGFAPPHSPVKFAYLEQQESPQTRVETPVEWTGSAKSGAGLSVVA